MFNELKQIILNNLINLRNFTEDKLRQYETMEENTEIKFMKHIWLFCKYLIEDSISKLMNCKTCEELKELKNRLKYILNEFKTCLMYEEAYREGILKTLVKTLNFEKTKIEITRENNEPILIVEAGEN